MASSSAASPSSSKWLTLRGFLKADVYGKFDAALDAGDHVAACYAMAELACTHGELRPFLSHVAALLCRHRLSTNAWVLRNALELLVELDGRAGRKNAMRDVHMQRTLCALVLAVAQEKRKEAGSLVARAAPPPGTDLDVLVCTVPEDPELAERYAQHLTSPLSKRLTAVRHYANVGDARNAITVLHGLCEVRAKKTASEISPAPFDFVVHLNEALRKDVAWYAWDALLIACPDPESATGRYVRDALMLFLWRYAKKARNDRLPLLHYACAVAAGKNARDVPASSGVTRAACREIQVVFCEVMGLPLPRTEYLSYYVERDAS